MLVVDDEVIKFFHFYSTSIWLIAVFTWIVYIKSWKGTLAVGIQSLVAGSMVPHNIPILDFFLIVFGIYSLHKASVEYRLENINADK